MTILPDDYKIASAFFVTYGHYGEVTHYAQQRGVCRQWICQEADTLRQEMAQTRHETDFLQRQLDRAHHQIRQLQTQLDQAVVLDGDTQAEVAPVAQARGVTRRACRELLQVLRPGQILSVAELGRRTQEAGRRAGALLAVLDGLTQPRVTAVAADEIYVKAPVLMVVEPDSLCWLSGRLADTVSGEAWVKELAPLPHLGQVMRDGGSGLAKGVELVNADRQAQGKPWVVDQGDHFHALRHGGVGLSKAQRQAGQALAVAEAAQKDLERCSRQGQSRAGIATRVSRAWQKAEAAFDVWQARERLWQQAKEALLLFPPDGVLNTRARARSRWT